MSRSRGRAGGCTSTFPRATTTALAAPMTPTATAKPRGGSRSASSRPLRGSTSASSTSSAERGARPRWLSFAHVSEREIDLGGIRLHVVEEGTGPLVVLCHGFPELAYSWRHQIPALAAAGYRVIAPDMRGFGRSSAPADVDAYDVVSLCGDMTGLLDALGEESAIFVGHDW